MNKILQYRTAGLRRLLSLLLALLITVSAAAASVVSSSDRYVQPTSNSVNYYTYNGTSLSSQGLLSVSSAYLVTGVQTIGNTEYSIIQVNGVSCYVKSANLQVVSGNAAPAAAQPVQEAQPAQPASSAAAQPAAAAAGTYAGTVRVTLGGTSNIRSAAHMVSGNIIATVKQGTELPFLYTVVPPSGNHVWYYVYHAASNQYGYIVDDCVKVVSMEPGTVIATLPPAEAKATAAPNVPAAASNAIGYIRIIPKGKTNIRKTTKVDTNNVAAQAEQNEVLPYYAMSVVDGATWLYVYYAPKAVFGYVLGTCAERVSESGASVPSAATPVPQSAAAATGEPLGYIQFTAGGVNLRKTASTAAKVLGRFDKGDVTPYYGTVSSGGVLWYQVRKDNESGYVMADFAQQVGSNGSVTPGSGSGTLTQGYLMTTTDKVYIRKRAGTDAGVYGQVPGAGTVLPIVGNSVRSGNVTWYPVTWNGNTGYIHGGFVTVLNSDQINAYQNGLPMPTATPGPTAVPKNVDYVATTADKVWIRKSPSTGAGTKGQANLGAVFHFTGTTVSGGVRWYKVEYAGEICYIMAKYCRVITDAELAAYRAGQSPVDNGSAVVPAGTVMSNTAVTTMEKVIVRASGASNGKQIALLYRSNQVCSLLGNTNVSNGYTWYNVQVNGITGWIRGDLLRILTQAEADAYNNQSSASGSGSSVNGVVLYRPELIDWYTGGIQDIFYKGCVAIVTDVKTGISFQARRWSGGDHADVEPYTAADTAAMCRIYGVSSAQEINDKNLYQRRPVLVTVGSRSFAASMYGVPHNYPEGDTIPDNNFNGEFCIHFVNSKLHGGTSGKNKSVDKDHQNAIMYAYEHAAELLGIQ